MTKLTIALLGVGLMGAPYARHLVADGHTVRLYNRTRAKAEAIEGADAFDTPEEATQGAEVLISLLADDRAVLAQVTQAVLAGLVPRGTHLSCSTISVETTVELARRARKAGRDHLSCPFLGRPDVVAKRGHQFLCSGTAERRDEMVALLRSTSSGVVDFGETIEAAVTTKIATNSMIATAVTAMSETFALLDKSGVDKEKAYELWTASLFNCPLYKLYGRAILDGDHDDPRFLLRLALKDVTLMRDAAQTAGSAHGLVQAVRGEFEKSVEAGHGDLDFTGLSRRIRQESGLE